MKFLIFASLVLFAGTKNPDPGLPFEQDLTKVEIGLLPKTNDLKLTFLLGLPLDHHLNPGAPSALGIYEKTGKENWTLTQKISLNEYPVSGSEMHFYTPIKLRSSDSEVAIFATVFHCRLDNTRCQIQGFKAKTIRSAKKSNSAAMTFSIQAVTRD